MQARSETTNEDGSPQSFLIFTLRIGPRKKCLADRSAISWTSATWNWATGCTKIDPQICDSCYMFTLYPRLKKMGLPTYRWKPNEVHVHDSMLAKPLEWRKPRRIFVNSMSDFFHEKIPFQYLNRVLGIIRATPQHTYQVPTKRSLRMLEYGQRIGGFPDNMWLGVSVGTKVMKFKIDHLRKVKAKTRFLSLEPLLESLVPLDLTGIHWVIVGGLSGPNWKDHGMDLNWAREIRDLCIREHVPFFFKQSSALKPGHGTLLDGRRWRQFPVDRHVRTHAAI